VCRLTEDVDITNLFTFSFRSLWHFGVLSKYTRNATLKTSFKAVFSWMYILSETAQYICMYWIQRPGCTQTLPYCREGQQSSPTDNYFCQCGNKTASRLFLDFGSTITMKAESFIQRIGIPRTHARISVVGLGASPAGVSLLSRTKSASLEVSGLIMSFLTSLIPSQQDKSSAPFWN